MNELKQFLAGHSISAHTFVGLFASFTTFLALNPTARGTLFGFLDRHPFYSMAFGFASFAYARYAGSHSTEGQIAELAAKQVFTNPTNVTPSK